jgi:hypothetical protein
MGAEQARIVRMTRSLCLAVLIILSVACGRDSESRETTMAGIQLRPMEAPPGVRDAAARRFGPTTQVTYLRLTPDTYAVQGMKGDRMKEIRVTAMGEPLNGADEEEEDEDDEDDDD